MSSSVRQETMGGARASLGRLTRICRECPLSSLRWLTIVLGSRFQEISPRSWTRHPSRETKGLWSTSHWWQQVVEATLKCQWESIITNKTTTIVVSSYLTSKDQTSAEAKKSTNRSRIEASKCSKRWEASLKPRDPWNKVNHRGLSSVRPSPS